jgi:ABC-type multidrug transport system ATPase subunit
MSDEAIRIKRLVKQYANFKLGPLDLTVPRGAIYGLIGPNGSGKTTTINLLMGLAEEDSGRIQVLGMDHRKSEVAVKARVGFVSPDLKYEPWGYPRRLIKFIRRFYDDWDDAYCAELMARLGIDADEKISAMSFGNRIKLSLVVALAHRPDLLLLDEPTLGLDAVSKRTIFAELLDAVRDSDRTVLISSHGLTDLERFADHIGMIKDGRLLFEGPTDEIVERFRIVDFEAENGAAPPQAEGATLLEQEGTRVRALVLIGSEALGKYENAGFRETARSPVTLEDLFVALVGEN